MICVEEVRMSFGDSISVAIFCFAVVFGLLGLIYLLIKASTRIINYISSRIEK